MNRTFIALIVVVILGVLGVLIYSSTARPAASNIPPGNTTIPGDTGTTPTSVSMTVQGTFVCLPHKDKTGPQTMECAFGLKADDGSYYALDWGDSSTSAFDLPMDRKFSVTGLFTPLQALNSDHWNIYDVRGIIKVASYAEISSGIPKAPLDTKLTLELKKSVIVADTTIKATAVTQDSRCPSDVNCIWAGKAVVTFNIISPSGTSNMELELGKSATTESLIITLEDVLPHPISTHKTTDSEYRFIVTVKSR